MNLLVYFYNNNINFKIKVHINNIISIRKNGNNKLYIYNNNIDDIYNL